MKKWMYSIIGLIIVGTLLSGVMLYKSIKNPEVQLEARAEQAAREQAGIKKITDIEHFHGTTPYHVVYGMNDHQEQMIVWVPDEGGKLLIRPENKGLSKEAVLDYFAAEVNPRKVIDVRLGVEQQLPVWEITYLDRKDRYSFYYLSFDDGKFVKRYSLQHK